ncbi:hypothetical protein ND856_19085 [Leptospira bandrabouensis]|uniref:hypothetical protein n=1 Tax=Leptospira bandrabouensis TaxID=2484903 RepID=UPI00223E78CA|nr:hypothetical protein [Leptospira bandrabouensis]MCW7460419.1 hypothetical protein [Leptospira bandrabouensis]MCW7479413.1 hypothetical protein [Leptospira bandrabouensis]MCW7487095.1 hypothetical protein [Leptospira bandrabouensis]
MNKEKFIECEKICEEAIKDLELSQLPLSNICLKAMRIARLLNDEKQYLAFKNSSVYIPRLESYIESSKIQLRSAIDPNVSISSANPNQYVSNTNSNRSERQNLSKGIMDAEEKLQTEKVVIYDYLISRYNELKFEKAAADIFDTARELVDSKLNTIAPETIRKFISAYENIDSTNPEDWANAVHSCRRILNNIADNLYPPRNGEEVESGGKKIKIGSENYINRLILYVESLSKSKSFQKLFSSNLEFLGNRLDSIYNAANKGTHNEIETAEDAKRYVIYTYLLIWDILTLS